MEKDSKNTKNTNGWAEATTELAKLGHRAFDFVDDTQRFFDNLMGDMVKDGVGLLSDRLKYFRLERAYLLAYKVQKKLEQRGIKNIRPVQPKIALPIIDAATIEDEDSLHDLWANLLVSAMNSNAELVKSKYIAIIKTLDADDVSLLKRLKKQTRTKERAVSISSLIAQGFSPTAIQHLYSVGIVTISFFEKDEIGNLFNTGYRATLDRAIRHTVLFDGIDNLSQFAPIKPGARFLSITDLGYEFLKAAIDSKN